MTQKMKSETNNICLDRETEMVVRAETSELICQSCGRVESLFEVSFDEAQFFNEESETG